MGQPYRHPPTGDDMFAGQSSGKGESSVSYAGTQARVTQNVTWMTFFSQRSPLYEFLALLV